MFIILSKKLTKMAKNYYFTFLNFKKGLILINCDQKI